MVLNVQMIISKEVYSSLLVARNVESYSKLLHCHLRDEKMKNTSRSEND